MGSLAILHCAGAKALRCSLPGPNNSPNIHPSPMGHQLLLPKMPPALGLSQPPSPSKGNMTLPMVWFGIFSALLSSELFLVCQYSCYKVPQTEVTFLGCFFFSIIILRVFCSFGIFFSHKKSQFTHLLPQLPLSPNAAQCFLLRALSQFSVHLAASYPRQTELILRVRFGETLYQMLC